MSDELSDVLRELVRREVRRGIRAELALAWEEGWSAGDRDGYHSAQPGYDEGSVAANPYRSASVEDGAAWTNLILVTTAIADFEARQAKLRGLRDRERDAATHAFDAGYPKAGVHHMQHWNFYDQQLDQLVQRGVA